jgi:hypothetical protein
MDNYWKNVVGVPDKTLSRIRKRVEQLVSEGACLNEHPKGSSKLAEGHARFIRRLESTLEENWDELSEDEKVKIRFPVTKPIGEKVDIPNRGLCEIVRYELTKRFGLRVTYKLVNGNMFTWEHID